MIKISRFVVIYVLLGLGIVYLAMHEDIAVPMNTPFVQFPTEHAEWKMVGQAHLSEGVLAQLRPADYLARRYRNSQGQVVDLYIGYHSGGKDSGPIHSPRHCLPAGGWQHVSSENMTVETPVGPVHLVQAVYSFGQSNELFLYWFQVRERSLTSEYILKLEEIRNSILHRRRDASFIRISVSFELDKGQALETATRFVREFYPVIREFLPA
jgi:EpsI family protein